LAEPVAGLAEAERLTERTRRPPQTRSRRGTTKKSAPMFAGSSCTQTPRAPRVAVQLGGELRPRERVELLEEDDRRRSSAAARPLRAQLVADLAGAEEHPPASADLVVPITGRKRGRARSATGDDDVLVAQHALRRHHDQRLAPGRSAWRRSRWKYCAAVDGWQTCMLSSAASCRKRSRRARGVLRPLPLVAVRQQQHEAGEQAPLVLGRGEELVDDHLRAVDEVAELRLPEHQRLRVVAAKPYSKPSTAASDSVES
jgi:hypothetical protein